MNSLLTIIGAILLLLLFIVCIMVRMNKYPGTPDKDKAKAFLEGLSDNIYSSMCTIIAAFDPKDYSSLEEFESDVLRQIYSSVYGYIKEELEKAKQDDILTIMALKVLNEEYIITFIDSLIESYSIMDKLTSIENSVKIEESTEATIEEDAKLNEKFSDSELYNNEFTNENLAPTEEVGPTEEELAKLNPQTDEEKEYDPESDSSVELIEDDTYIDSSGRKRNKKTGRFA